MVIASHVILTGYGFWLPNDPRGSMSFRVWSAVLRDLADPHYGRRQKQPSVRDLRAFHRRAADRLAYPLLWFHTAYRQIIAEAFCTVMEQRRYTCYACAIVTNHAHLIVRRHRDDAHEIINHLKLASAERLRIQLDVPNDHPIWSADPYAKYLNTPDAVRQAVDYVERNFAKSRLTEQDYPFVIPYTGEWSGKRTTR